MPLHALMLALAVGSAPPDALQSGTYRYTFEGTFWNAEKRAFAADETVVRDASGMTLRVAPDGAAARDAKPAERAAYDDVTAILARGALTPGAAWNAAVTLQTGQTEKDTTAVPLAVRVARSDADGVLVQATGTVHAISVSGSYRSPIDVTVRVAALVRDGALLRFDEDVTDYVHAGPLSQEMRWHWSLARSS